VSPSRVALLYAFAFAAAWAGLELVAARLQGGYDVLQVEGCRFAAQLLFMLALWGWRGPAPLWRTRRPFAQLLRAGLMLAIPLGFGIAVLQGATPHLALTGLWVAPVLALALAQVRGGDRVPLGLWVAGAAGLLATVAMLDPARPATLQAAWVPLGMGLAFALYLALTRSLRDEPVLTNLFYVGLGGLLGVLPLLPAVWVAPSGHDAAVFAVLGLLGFGALWLLEQALRRWSLPWIAPALYVHVAGLTLASLLLRGHRPSLRVACGLLLVAAVGVALWRAAGLRDDPRRAPAPGGVWAPASGPVPLDDDRAGR